MQLATALLSGAIVVAAIYLGRRDLSRPAVVFGVVWFGAVLLAQLRLTSAEFPWSTGFTAITVGGGVTFVLASLFVAGTRGARAHRTVDESRYNANRLLIAAAVLVCGGAVGWAYKSSVLGGIPLLSSSADATRARAVSASGQVVVPTWSSALTGGFYLGFWMLLAVIWLKRRSASRAQLAAIGLLAAGALFGVALDASRNLVLLAVSIPIVAAYLLSSPGRRARAAVRFAVAAVVFALIVGGAFVWRLDQASAGDSANTFLRAETHGKALPVRPLVPFYVNAVLPLDAYQRLYRIVPARINRGSGAYSLLSLPDAAFPSGKLDYGGTVKNQMTVDGLPGFWTVATYQGRAFADFGPIGVIAASVLLGLLFGGAYRYARRRSGLWPLVMIGYAVYYTGFMIYDNLLSSTLICVYDLTVVVVVDRLAREPMGSLVPSWLRLPRLQPVSPGPAPSYAGAPSYATAPSYAGAPSYAQPATGPPVLVGPAPAASDPAAPRWRGIVDYANRRSGGWAAIAVPCLAAAVMVVVLGSRLTFFNDDWAFVLQRPGFTAHAILDPSDGHFVALAVLIFKGLISAFGLGSQVPFRIVLAATVVFLGLGVFVFVRARLGVLAGVVAASLLMFLGPAWEDLLWSFQIGLIGSLATGVWALVFLERRRTRGDVAACVLLVASVTLSNLGLAFVTAALVVAIVRRRAADLWIAAIPGVLFAVWWLAYGHKDPSYITAGHTLALPEYVADSVAAALSSLTGLGGGILTSYNWGPTLLAVALVGAGVWIHRRQPPLRWLLVIAAAALFFWGLTGASFIPGREPVASRFQLISGTFVLLLAAELLGSIWWRPRALLAIAAAGLLAIGANLTILKNQGYEPMRARADSAKAALGALNIMRGHVGDDFRLTEGIAHQPYLAQVTAGAYFRETRAHGTPADTPGELVRASVERRQAADGILVSGYAIRLQPTTAARPPGVVCRTVARAAPGRPAALAPGTTRIVNRGPAGADLALRRFSSAGAATPIGSLAPGALATVAIPVDSARLVWRLESNAPVSLQACLSPGATPLRPRRRPTRTARATAPARTRAAPARLQPPRAATGATGP